MGQFQRQRDALQIQNKSRSCLAPRMDPPKLSTSTKHHKNTCWSQCVRCKKICHAEVTKFLPKETSLCHWKKRGCAFPLQSKIDCTEKLTRKLSGFMTPPFKRRSRDRTCHWIKGVSIQVGLASLCGSCYRLVVVVMDLSR